MQHVTRVDRHHRGRAAEQHREQVKRNRAKHRALAKHESQTFQEVTETKRLCPRGGTHGPEREHQAHHHHEQRHHGSVGDLRPTQQQHAAQRRAHDHASGEQRRVDGDRGRKRFARHEIRRDGLPGRHPECTARAEHRHRDEHGPHGLHAGQREPQQRKRAGGFDCVGAHEHDASIESIRDLPRGQHT